PCSQPGLRRQLALRRPDVVVNVVPGWPGSVRRALDHVRNPAPVVTVVSDLITVNRSWISRAATAHVVPTAEAAAMCVAGGIPPAEIRCYGLPMPRLCMLSAPRRAEARRRLGLDPAAPTVLLMGGGEGSGRFETMLDTLAG